MAKGKWGVVEGSEDRHYWKGTVKRGYTPACGYIVGINKLDFKSVELKCIECFSVALAEQQENSG